MIIGITGGVGTGKSTVLDILREDYGAYVIRADDEGHRVMEKENDAYKRIVSIFGPEILDMCGNIDRKALGDIVFAQPSKLSKLNAIIHPEVKKSIIRMIDEIRLKEENYLIVIEAALLIEDRYDEICDELWYIYADDKTRFQRLSESRNYTAEKYAKIKENQLSHDTYLQKCAVMIDNSGDIEATKAQIAEIFGDKRHIFNYQ